MIQEFISTIIYEQPDITFWVYFLCLIIFLFGALFYIKTYDYRESGGNKAWCIVLCVFFLLILLFTIIYLNTPIKRNYVKITKELMFLK